MSRRFWLLASVLVVLLALGAVGLFLLTEPHPIAAATSPDGTWSVTVVGQRLLTGAYEIVVRVQSTQGQPVRTEGFVVGLTGDLDAARRNHAITFVDDSTAKVGTRILKKADFIHE